MYPNLYYVFKDLFGVEWNVLKILNTFGLMVALAFIAAAIVMSRFIIFLLDWNRMRVSAWVNVRRCSGIPASC